MLHQPPRYGDLRVCDYASYGHGDTGFIVEEYRGDGRWVLPAWDEQGHGDLEGPFATEAEAQQALDGAF